MAHTQVLLREDIDNLGARGEIVRVKSGYARNYLLPRKLAVEATANNMRQIQGERAALAKREAKERSTAELQADQFRKLNLKFERKVGEAGVLYGSVTSIDIAHQLKEQGSKSIAARSFCANPSNASALTPYPCVCIVK
jgi:large subunit ribosomal protein L9